MAVSQEWVSRQLDILATLRVVSYRPHRMMRKVDARTFNPGYEERLSASREVCAHVRGKHQSLHYGRRHGNLMCPQSTLHSCCSSSPWDRGAPMVLNQSHAPMTAVWQLPVLRIRLAFEAAYADSI
jgi:hypothetical protein